MAGVPPARNTPKSYPRPDFYRPGLGWQSLNGEWDFLFDDEDVGLSEQWYRGNWPDIGTARQAKPDGLRGSRKINVPFVFQTPASGIHDRGAHEVFWYQLQFRGRVTGPLDGSAERRLLLRFGAVDYEATVWFNGKDVGYHRGGHVPFDIDVTEAFERSIELQTVTVRVRDSPHDLTQPRGKQYWAPEPESIFYTPSSGIWQSVWLENVPAVRIADSSHGTILRANDIESGLLHAHIAIHGKEPGQNYKVEISAYLDDVRINGAAGIIRDHDCIDLEVNLHLSDLPEFDMLRERKGLTNGLTLWSPEQPNLYGVGVTLTDETGKHLDEVRTYTGIRSLDWTSGDGTFRLNGNPYFQALVLDQGYWPETGITPPSPEALMIDIELSKAMGFNGCRKHQKVEDPIFLYWADKLGYIVWGEMANAYKFDSTYVERFNQEWTEAVKRDLNHPCVFAWTPVNESWGYPELKDSDDQKNHIRLLYELTRCLDPSRPISDNDGWEHVQTDLITFHDYADADELTRTCAFMEKILSPKSGRQIFLDPIDPSFVHDPAGSKPRPGAPVICSEFGGINIAAPAGGETREKDWGYTTATNSNDLLHRIASMMNGIVQGGLCSGFVYTQL